MAGEERKQFAPDELAALFRALSESGSPCVLMGGQAANFWALHFAPGEPALREIQDLFPFVSKDVDFQGDRAAAIALARALGSTAQLPTFRRAFGNLMSGQFVANLGQTQLKIEVLRRIPGLTDAELSRLTTREKSGEFTIQVLNPVGVLLAKAWNVANIEQKGRHDAEQLLTIVPCVRAFVREFLVAAKHNSRLLRAALNLIKITLAFTESRLAAQATARCGVEWAQLLPHSFLAASRQPELIRLREKRVPGWLAQVNGYARPTGSQVEQRRLLEILAHHAEPWCAQPAAKRTSRTQHATRTR